LRRFAPRTSRRPDYFFALQAQEAPALPEQCSHLQAVSPQAQVAAAVVEEQPAVAATKPTARATTRRNFFMRGFYNFL